MIAAPIVSDALDFCGANNKFCNRCQQKRDRKQKLHRFFLNFDAKRSFTATFQVFAIKVLYGTVLYGTAGALRDSHFSSFDKLAVPDRITSETFTALLLMAIVSTMLTTPVVKPKLARLAALKMKG